MSQFNFSRDEREFVLAKLNAILNYAKENWLPKLDGLESASATIVTANEKHCRFIVTAKGEIAFAAEDGFVYSFTYRYIPFFSRVSEAELRNAKQYVWLNDWFVPLIAHWDEIKKKMDENIKEQHELRRKVLSMPI